MHKDLHKQSQLDNGLVILGEVNSAAQSSAVGFFVRTGSRDETKIESGVSHFLEHMMFKGTAKRSSLEITYDMGNIGAQANAYTSEENTVYYGAVLPEYFSKLQEILSDMLRPALDPSEFSTEKKVILEEIARYQDRPQFYLFENAMADFYCDHPAGNSVLGTESSISALQRDQMKDYFDRRYSPSNIVLVGSGNFDWDHFVRNANTHCGSWKNFKAERPLKKFLAKPVQKEYKKKNINQAHVLLLSPSCSAQDPARYALSLLAMIIGDSSGSKLYWDLIDSGIADSSSADNDERDGTGCFSVYASTEPASLEQAIKIIKKILEDPTDFTDQDLDRAKTKLVSKLVLSGEMPMGRLMTLGVSWNYRKSVLSLREVIDAVKGVQRSDILRALKEFPLNSWSEFRLTPQVLSSAA